MAVSACVPIFAQTPNPSPTDGVQYLVNIALTGSFLEQPEKEGSELLRRIGRQLLAHRAGFLEGKLSLAGFPGTASPPSNPFAAPMQADVWTPEQKALCERKKKEIEGEAAKLEKELPTPDTGLAFSGVVDPNRISFPQPPATEPGKTGPSRSRALDKLRFLQEFVSCLTFRGTLDKTAFNLRVDIIGGPRFPEVREQLSGLSGTGDLSRFLDPTALFNFYQVQKSPDIAEALADLRQVPQTAIVEGYLASAGLSFERDILPLSAEELAVIGNLEPSGEGGLPDLRLLGVVKDPAKLISIAPALKQLAVSLGVFIEISHDPIFSAKVKYFLLPQVSLHVSLVENILILTTGKPQLVETAKRISGIKHQGHPPTTIPPGLQRYWKIRFHDFNEQLQKLLQSPVLADKGIPPITNLTVLQELGDLLVTSKTQEDRVVISVSLPFSTK
jgi:hypothetical protein